MNSSAIIVNGTTIPCEASIGIFSLTVAGTLLVALCALCCYALVLNSIYRCKLHIVPFYTLVLHLALGNVLLLLLYILYAIPLSVWARITGGAVALPVPVQWVAKADTVLFNFSSAVITLMAANRLVAVLDAIGSGRAAARCFNVFKEHAQAVACLAWIYGLAACVLLELHGGCPKVFATCELHFTYKCPGDSLVFKAYAGASFALPFAALIMYAAIFAALRLQKRRRRNGGFAPNAAHECRMLAQAVAFWLGLCAENAAFLYLTAADVEWHGLATIATVLEILSHPLIMAYFTPALKPALCFWHRRTTNDCVRIAAVS